MEQMNGNDFDVLIIGAGPAGIAAALCCLQRGRRTLLLAKKNHQIENTSSRVESIHPGVIPLLQTLNIFSDFTAAKLGKFNFISNGEFKKSINPYNNVIWDGFHVSKQLFNDYLSAEAIAQNLIIQEATVKDLIIKDDRISGVVAESGENIFSKYVIDASGSQRILGRKMRFHEQFYSDSLIAWTGVSDNAVGEFDDHCSYFLPDKHGWTWLSKLADQSFYWTCLSSKKRASISIPDCLMKSSKSVIGGAFSTRWRIFRPLCFEGGVICGEAACLIDPATGQGVLNALSSGMMAAQTVLSCIDNKANESLLLAQYDNWYFNLFEQKAARLSNYYNEIGVDLRL